MRTGVPSASFWPKYSAVIPKAMNISPDSKSLLRNRINDASPALLSKKRRVVGPNPRPAQALNNHNSALLPKRHFRRAAAADRHGREGTSQTGGARARLARATTSARAAGATKSAGSESAARHDRVTSPTGRAKVVPQQEH